MSLATTNDISKDAAIMAVLPEVDDTDTWKEQQQRLSWRVKRCFRFSPDWLCHES